jgi:hypothetical protein
MPKRNLLYWSTLEKGTNKKIKTTESQHEYEKS